MTTITKNAYQFFEYALSNSLAGTQKNCARRSAWYNQILLRSEWQKHIYPGAAT
jgi:hypothetical protein